MITVIYGPPNTNMNAMALGIGRAWPNPGKSAMIEIYATDKWDEFEVDVCIHNTDGRLSNFRLMIPTEEALQRAIQLYENVVIVLNGDCARLIDDKIPFDVLVSTADYSKEKLVGALKRPKLDTIKRKHHKKTIEKKPSDSEVKIHEFTVRALDGDHIEFEYLSDDYVDAYDMAKKWSITQHSPQNITEIVLLQNGKFVRRFLPTTPPKIDVGYTVRKIDKDEIIAIEHYSFDKKDARATANIWTAQPDFHVVQIWHEGKIICHLEKEQKNTIVVKGNFDE